MLSRIFHAALFSFTALYPDLRQRIANQEEAELRAIDVEKRLVFGTQLPFGPFPPTNDGLIKRQLNCVPFYG